MNGLQYWPAPHLPNWPVRVAQPDRGLAGVHADAEHLPLELGEQVAHLGRRRRLDAEPGLPGAEERAAVLAPAVLERASFVGRWTSNQFGSMPWSL
jgi:hypothetical protein